MQSRLQATSLAITTFVLPTHYQLQIDALFFLSYSDSQLNFDNMPINLTFIVFILFFVL